MATTGFSVLMSVYYKEQPEFFDLALDSILVHQSVPPNEFVLVCDGGLTDGLESVITKYKELFPDILKVYRKENGGLGKALNFGLDKCSYPLVARADSDDVCDCHRFEKQLAYMEAHPEIGISSTYIDEFETDWTKPLRVRTVPLDHEDIVKMVRFRNPFNHMTVMMKREQVLAVGSYQDVMFVEDHYLWLRATVNGVKMGNIGEILVHARVGKGMLKRRSNPQYITGWRVLNKYMRANGMIGWAGYLGNMIMVRLFVYTPPVIKDFLYNKILRKKVNVS